MHFTGTIWRPPYEAGSDLLQVTSGCTHHRCRFCTLYPNSFRLSPMEEIASDIDELAHVQPYARRVWLTGAHPFGIGEGHLMPVLSMIRDRLPKVESIGGFVRIGDLRHKTDADLVRWASLGVDGLTIGVESGDDAALDFMDKGHRAADIIEQCGRLDNVGIGYHFFYLVGMAGHGHCVAAARASADVFNNTHPRTIGALSMTLFPESRLAKDVNRGSFKLASELELIEEIRELIAYLKVETIFSTAHVSDTVHVHGRLPRDRAPILAELDEAIHAARGREESLREYRRAITSL